MTLNEAKDQIAIKNNYTNWTQLVDAVGVLNAIPLLEQAAELYAEMKGKSISGILPMDKDIEDWVDGINTEWFGSGKVVFIRGAKWLRDKLVAK